MFCLILLACYFYAQAVLSVWCLPLADWWSSRILVISSSDIYFLHLGLTFFFSLKCTDLFCFHSLYFFYIKKDHLGIIAA